MTKKFYETEEFLKLQKEWYDKLAEDGFEDCEYTDPRTGEVGNLMKGKSFSSLAAAFRTMGAKTGSEGKRTMREDGDTDKPQPAQYATEMFFAKQDYFRFAGQFYWHLERRPWSKENAYKLAVWGLVADGHSVAQIANLLGKPYGGMKKTVDALHVEFRKYLDKEIERDT